FATASSLTATVVISYTADSTSTAENPTEQGWLQAGTFTETSPFPGDITINGTDYNYWSISNTGSEPNAYSARYQYTLDSNALDDPEGWTVTAKVRVISSFGTYNAAWLNVADGENSWDVSFVNNGTNGSFISYRTTENNLTVL